MLAVAVLLFAVILQSGVRLSGPGKGIVLPASIGVALGAFIFGVGMQIGGSCASGTLFAVGSGQTAILYTLGGFILGSIGSAFAANWITYLQSLGPTVSLAETPLDYGGGVLFSLLIIGTIVGGSLLLQRRRNPPPIEPAPVARDWTRVLRGAWPLWVGAILLAVLNSVTLFISGSPWGITATFALWGAKFLGWIGIDISNTPYWTVSKNATALHASVLAGAFVLHRAVPWKMAVGAVIGGVAMGFGARMAGGCNIGAYFSGVASFSLHGWLWGAAAIVGTYVGVPPRPLFGLGNPNPPIPFAERKVHEEGPRRRTARRRRRLGRRRHPAHLGAARGRRRLPARPRRAVPTTALAPVDGLLKLISG